MSMEVIFGNHGNANGVKKTGKKPQQVWVTFCESLFVEAATL